MGNCLSSPPKPSDECMGIGEKASGGKGAASTGPAMEITAVPAVPVAEVTAVPALVGTDTANNDLKQQDQEVEKGSSSGSKVWHDRPMSEVHAKGLQEVEAALAKVQGEMKRDRGVDLDLSRVSRADTLTLAEPGSITPVEALAKLMGGHRRFLAGDSAHPHQSEQWLQQLTKTQRPFAAVLSCSDSRVPVETLFDVGFGDLFVCRVAGNIATNEEIGSLEYSVVDCGVSVIMVMGHAKCGACKTALTGKSFPGYIDILVDALGVPLERACAKSGISSKACKATDMDLLKSVVEENVRYQMERLMRSAVLHAAVEAGKLKVVGGYYHLDSGHVSLIE